MHGNKWRIPSNKGKCKWSNKKYSFLEKSLLETFAKDFCKGLIGDLPPVMLGTEYVASCAGVNSGALSLTPTLADLQCVSEQAFHSCIDIPGCSALGGKPYFDLWFWRSGFLINCPCCFLVHRRQRTMLGSAWHMARMRNTKHTRAQPGSKWSLRGPQWPEEFLLSPTPFRFYCSLVAPSQRWGL